MLIVKYTVNTNMLLINNRSFPSLTLIFTLKLVQLIMKKFTRAYIVMRSTVSDTQM
jgi:hypothetical protein